MQRSYRLLLTAVLSVVVLYKLFTYSGSTDFSSVTSSWSKAHPESQPDAHKEVIAGDQKVHDKVSEHKIAEHALDALPGGYKSPATGGSSNLPPVVNALANATQVARRTFVLRL